MQKWSHSLDSQVKVCRRKVFYSARYASHSATKGSPRHEAFLLKQALDPQNWRGRLVHSAISDHILLELAQHQWPDFDSARKHALELLDRQLAFSRAGLYRTTSKTKAGNDYCVLRANLKGEELPISDLEKVRHDVIHALTVLETNYIELLERIRGAKWLLAEADPQKIRSSAIRFKLDDEILIEAIPDLIFCEWDNRAVIVDWKAVESKRRNARDQLFTYAFAVLNCGRWTQLSADRLELMEVNLLTGESATFTLTGDDLDLVDERIFLGSELLRSIFERSVSECKPDDFAPADSPIVCQYCPLSEVCNGRITQESNQLQPVLFEFI